MGVRCDQPQHSATDDLTVVEPGAADGARSPDLPGWIYEIADVDRRRAASEPTGAETAQALLTVREKAAELRVSERTVRRLIKRGELPHVKVGRLYRLSPQLI